MTGLLIALLAGIGKAVLWILLIVVLLFALLLLVPVRYRAEVSKHGDTTSVRAGVSWLLRFVHLRLSLESAGKTKESQTVLRIAGISVLPLAEKLRKKKKPCGAAPEAQRTVRMEAAKKPTVPPGRKLRPDAQQKPPLQIEVVKAAKPSPVHRMAARIAAWIGRLKRLGKKLQTTSDLAAEWFAYLSSASFASAKDTLLQEGTAILRHVFPKRICGSIRGGTEDPATTGMLFGMAAMLCPPIPDTLEILPEFTEACLEAEVDAGGRIVLGVVLTRVVRILMSRDVRRLIRRFRKKERVQGHMREHRRGKGRSWQKTKKTMYFKTT